MASDDTMTIHSSMQEEDDDVDYEEDDHHHHHHSMSRLSMCTSSITHSTYSYDDNSNDDDDDDTAMRMSRLSVDDGSDVEADGELSDEKETGGSDDSEKETGWSSLPTTPQRRILQRSGFVGVEYASESEGRHGPCRRRGWTSARKGERRLVRERWLERAWEMRKCRAVDEEMESGDSECMVIAKAKGGGRCLSMDMEEVKACRDLGFQLQNDWTLEIPCRISASTIDTDSGGNSPIANWRISSPGDDPRDVKARLKVWAQAVALASASRLNT